MTSLPTRAQKDLSAVNVKHIASSVISTSSQVARDPHDWRPKRKFLLLVTAAGETNAGTSCSYRWYVWKNSC